MKLIRLKVSKESLQCSVWFVIDSSNIPLDSFGLHNQTNVDYELSIVVT